MNKICTSLEQSKKLIELGIDVNTADMMWVNDGLGEPFPMIVNKNLYEEDIPAWSLSTLLGLMPFHIIENNKYRFGFYHVKGFNKQGETYCFGYKTNNDSFLFKTSWYNDVVDAAFELIYWLKENNKI